MHVLFGGSPETATVTPEDCPDLDIHETISLIILQHITWPHEDDDDYSLDTKCRISGYLRHFIENASPDELTDLLKFWTGWEIMPRNNLSIEVVKGSFPTASTCFETLRIPGHYKDYASFKNDILACIGTCQTGFGLV